MRCVDVTWEMGDGSYDADLGWWDGGGIGSLLWNPKGGEGHVLVGTARCGDVIPEGCRRAGSVYDCGCGGWGGACGSEVMVCECGEDDSWRDHHYRLLRRAPQDASASEERT